MEDQQYLYKGKINNTLYGCKTYPQVFGCFTWPKIFQSWFPAICYNKNEKRLCDKYLSLGVKQCYWTHKLDWTHETSQTYIQYKLCVNIQYRLCVYYGSLLSVTRILPNYNLGEVNGRRFARFGTICTI